MYQSLTQTEIGCGKAGSDGFAATISMGEKELIGTNWRRLREHREEIDRKKSVFLQFLFCLFCFFERKLFFWSLSVVTARLVVVVVVIAAYEKTTNRRDNRSSTFHFFFFQDVFFKVTVSLFFFSFSLNHSFRRKIVFLFVTWISFHFPIRSLWSYEPAQWWIYPPCTSDLIRRPAQLSHVSVHNFKRLISHKKLGRFIKNEPAF